MVYYVDIDLENGDILSMGYSIDLNSALKDISGKFVELTENQFKMLVACKGKIKKGHYYLYEIENKIKSLVEEW